MDTNGDFIMSVKENQETPANEKQIPPSNVYQDKFNLYQDTPINGPSGALTIPSISSPENGSSIWRILFNETARLLSACLFDSQVFHDGKESAVSQLARLRHPLKNTGDMEDERDEILIRYHAQPIAPIKNKSDYEILYGNSVIGCGMVPELFNGTLASAFSKKLIQVFNVFAHYGFNQLYLKLHREHHTDITKIRTCLYILSCFKTAHYNISNQLSTNRMDHFIFPFNANTDGRSSFLTCPYDHVNYGIVRLKKAVPDKADDAYIIDDVKWLMLSRGTAFHASENNRLARFVIDNMKGSPNIIADIMQNAVDNQFMKIDLNGDVPEIIKNKQAINPDVNNTSVQGHSFEDGCGDAEASLEKEGYQIFDQAFSNQVWENSCSANKHCTYLLTVPDNTDKVIAIFRDVSVENEKQTGTSPQPFILNEGNFQAIAREFNITLHEAQKLVESLKDCFDVTGQFNKDHFIHVLARFSKQEKRIFEFLWYHLKAAIHKDDRVSFLNSVQCLVQKMRQPLRALKILLDDFCAQPLNVNFYDNMAIMLANLIAQKHDRHTMDLETTPEDILIKNDYIDNAVASYAAWRIEKRRTKIIKKIKAIHDKLLISLQVGKIGSHQIFARHLLSLEKEVYILLSLKESLTGQAILRMALYEYGNPDSKIYTLKKSQIHLAAILQNLRAIIYGVGRVGNSDDLFGLKRVHENLADFLDLLTVKKHRDQVKMMDKWVSDAEISIISRF